MDEASGDFRTRWKELAGAFLKIGAMSYGGPAIMGIMQAEIQEKRGWLTKERFLEGLALVNMLPGAAATQLGIFIGYQRAGWRGGALAGICFILPAFLIMLALTLLYSAFGALPLVRDAFYGIGPVVLGIFIVAVWRLGRTAMKGTIQIAIAVVAALLIAFTPLGIISTLLLAGCAGVALYHSRTRGLYAALAVMLLSAAYNWVGPLFAAHGIPADGTHAVVGVNPSPWDIGAFFFKVGIFTFGGGITVLAFVQEQVVSQLQWLTQQEFLDGLALGQLTPGPILMLAAYVGYKLSGIAGAIAGACAIFAPAFILMLSIVPVLNRVRDVAWIKAAMRAIGAAVIGIITVSLIQMAPHAIPDAFTAFLALLTVAGLLAWNLGPLPLMLGGAAAGTLGRANPLQRLKELV
ncbi:MAG: chromate efflux transporter [Betaproteobacteria bacterium]|nr:chromate efflux transporter [Betaproteobacteria bacterium]